MKVQIRQGVFETNSSSTHSITMCSGQEWKDWMDDKIRMSPDGNPKFLPRDEAIEANIKHALEYYDLSENNTEDRQIIEKYRNTGDIDEFGDAIDEYFDKYECYLTYDEWDDYFDYEKYRDSYTTASGEEVVAFGYYGNDY